MKVAHVVENLKRGGGVPPVVVTLAGQMATQGVDVSIVMLKDRIEYPLAPGVRTIHAPINGLSRRQWLRQWLGERLLGNLLYCYLFSPWFSQQLATQLRDQQFDCLYFHGLGVCHAMHCWRQGNDVLVLHNLKSVQLRDDSARKTRANYAMYTKVLAGKRLIAVSAAVRADAIRTFQVHPDRITAVNNPVDVAQIRQQAQQPYQGPAVALAADYLVFVGRLNAQKRVDVLLNAYRQAGIREQLLILGRGEQQADLIALANRLGIADRVHFLGYVENPYPYMRQAKALVLSPAYEGLPTVLIEALACGTCIVSTRVGGAEEILAGPLAAGLIEPGDINALVNKLRAVVGDEWPTLEDSTLLQRFGRATSAAQYLDVARQLASSH